MRKAWILILAAVVVVGIVWACSRSSSDSDSNKFNDPGATDLVEEYPYLITESSLFIRRDGTISAADVEEFSEDYYDIDEFTEDYVEPVVISYNEQQGLAYAYADETDETLPVAINSITVEDDVLTLQLDYASAEDYLAFNKEINEYFSDWETFVICLYDELEEYGIAIDVTLYDEDGNEVDLEDEDTSELYVCVLGFNGDMPIEFSGRLQFEGEVVYITEGIEIESSNIVTVDDSESLQYIIFK